VQCDQFPEAVSADAVGFDTRRTQRGQQRGALHGQRRLSPLGPGEQGLLRRSVLFRERRDGEHHPVQGELVVEGQLRRTVPHLPGLRQVHGEVGPHAGVLAALAGEEQRQPSGLGGTGAVGDTERDGQRPVRAGPDQRRRLVQPGREVLRVRGGQGEPVGVGRAEGPLCVRGLHGEGPHAGCHFLCPPQELLGRGAAEEQQFGGRGPGQGCRVGR
jgi:hypothetical protein